VLLAAALVTTTFVMNLLYVRCTCNLVTTMLCHDALLFELTTFGQNEKG
jgi:hypothetical protein